MGGFRGRLEITDGTTFIDLLGNSPGSILSLLEWEPAAPDIKNSGIWTDNPLLDGRELAIRTETNITETFTLVGKGQTATDILVQINLLRRMLIRATGYWTNRAKYPDPIYLLIQYPEEDEPYWSIIYDWRLPQITNPYIQPLYGQKKAVIPEFTLVIERGYRFPITGLACADLDYDRTYYNLSTDEFEPAASNEDCEVNLSALSINLVSINAWMGVYTTTRYGIGVRFNNVTIPAGSIIKRAYITCVPAAYVNNEPSPLLIDGEANTAPAVFSTYADYIGRTRTVTNRWVASSEYENNWVQGTPVDIPAPSPVAQLEEIIQEIIDLPGWASGNNLVLFIEPYGAVYNKQRWVAMWDSVTYDPIKLNIEWIDPDETKIVNISGDDCEFNAITNQMNFNQIWSVKRYNGTTLAYTDLTGTALPWSLFSASSLNSAIYFACNLDTVNYTSFYALVFNLTAAFDTAITVVWEYWNGVGWVGFTDLVDGTNGFHNVGDCVVHWTPEDFAINNWVNVVVDGVDALWARARISVGGVSAVPVHDGNNEVNTPAYPYLDWSLQAQYFLRRFMRMEFSTLGSGTTIENYFLDEIWIASRKPERGTKFVPYINLTEWASQLPAGVTITENVLITYGYLLYTPAYWVALYSAGGAVAEIDALTVTFDENIAGHYYGKYRVFLRRYAFEAGSTPENGTYRLRLTTDTAGATPIQYQSGEVVDTDNLGFSIIDFGTLEIPSNLETFSLVIAVAVANPGLEVYYTDLILLPADEMLVRAYQRIDDNVTAPIAGDITTKLVVENDENGDIIASIERNSLKLTNLIVESNAPFEAEPGENYRFWFFAGTYTSECLNYQRQYWPGLDLGIALKFLDYRI